MCCSGTRGTTTRSYFGILRVIVQENLEFDKFQELRNYLELRMRQPLIWHTYSYLVHLVRVRCNGRYRTVIMHRRLHLYIIIARLF